MKEIRCSFAVMVLFITLGGLLLSGMAPALIASTASGQHTTIVSRATTLTYLENPHVRPLGICPDGGPDDC